MLPTQRRKPEPGNENNRRRLLRSRCHHSPFLSPRGTPTVRPPKNRPPLPGTLTHTTRVRGQRAGSSSTAGAGRLRVPKPDPGPQIRTAGRVGAPPPAARAPPPRPRRPSLPHARAPAARADQAGHHSPRSSRMRARHPSHTASAASDGDSVCGTIHRARSSWPSFGSRHVQPPWRARVPTANVTSARWRVDGQTVIVATVPGHGALPACGHLAAGAIHPSDDAQVTLSMAARRRSMSRTSWTAQSGTMPTIALVRRDSHPALEQRDERSAPGTGGRRERGERVSRVRPDIERPALAHTCFRLSATDHAPPTTSVRRFQGSGMTHALRRAAVGPSPPRR